MLKQNLVGLIENWFLKGEGHNPGYLIFVQKNPR